MSPRTVVKAASVGLLDSDPVHTQDFSEPFRPDLRVIPIDWLFEQPPWFDQMDELNPNDETQTKIWVDSQGRAAAWYYHADACYIDTDENQCWTASPSPTGNEIFHQSSATVVDDSGELFVVQAGVIGAGGEHAPIWMSIDAAAKYYQDVDHQKLIGRIYDVPGIGGYFLGAVLPTTTVGDVAMTRRAGLSGDWRWRMYDNAGHRLNAYDAVGPWMVTRPALPLNRKGYSVARLAAIGSEHPVYISGGAVMPWHIEHRGNEWCVIQSRNDETAGCHPTMDKANAQMAALYANEPKAAAVTGDMSLPLASRDMPWDGAAATQAVESWANGDPAKLAKAFLYRDDAKDPKTIGAYKLGFADIVSGELQIVPRGVFAVAGSLSGARGGPAIPADEQATIRGHVNSLYERMAKEFSDDTIVSPLQAAVTALDPVTAATPAPPPTPPPTPPPAPVDQTPPDAQATDANARLDEMESRLDAVEAVVADLVMSGVQVDELMPADQQVM